MANDHWDFSAYEMDFSKLDQNAEKQTINEKIEFDLLAAQPLESVKPKEDSSIESEPAAVVPTDAQVQKKESVATLQTEEQSQIVRRKPTSLQKEPSIKKEEIVELVEKLENLTDMVNVWVRQLEEIRNNAKEQLPKGIRISIHRLEEATNVFKAFKTIIETVMEEETSEILLALEDNKVPSCCNRMTDSFMRHNEMMEEIIDRLKEDIDTVDPGARTKARELKQKVLSIHSDTVTMAETLTQFILAYPDKHGELTLFSRIVAKEDAEKMDQIDHAIMVTDQFVVSVADAPAMIKALEEEDKETMNAILSRMIDNRSAYSIQ